MDEAHDVGLGEYLKRHGYQGAIETVRDYYEGICDKIEEMEYVSVYGECRSVTSYEHLAFWRVSIDV